MGKEIAGWREMAIVTDNDGEDSLAIPTIKRLVMKRPIGNAVKERYVNKPSFHIIHVKKPFKDF